ncbi:SCO6880 family protein [Nocardia sp. NPDC127526]|uniref:SCO6880 family protein n=1 Tax=Nocardia sp. NPDC127526 TaxID=3345393 RepID=UPI003636AF77
MTAPTPAEDRTYGMWVRPRREGMFGMTWWSTVAVFTAVVLTLLVIVVAGTKAGLVVAGVAALMLIPAVWQTGGQSGYERGLIVAQWWRAVWKRENVYRAGVYSFLGSCRLPGLMAAARLQEFISADGQPFGMVHFRDFDLYTVVLRAWPQGARAVDQDMINLWVASWGQLLASLGGQPDIEALWAVNDSVPETGNSLAAEAAYLTHPDAPEMARAVMDELVDELPSDTVRQESWFSVTFRAATPERRKNPQEQAVEIGRRLPGIITALGEAGVKARPMDASEVIALVRRAWDPASESDLEAAAERGEPHGISWADAGPVSYEEHRGDLWHDGVTSVTWEMELAPEGNVRERVLQRLLEPSLEVPRKRVALVYRPHSAGDATQIVNDDFRDALTAQNASRSNLGSAHTAVRIEAAEEARDEQARGHGVTRFAALITVTEPDNGRDVPSLEAITKDLGLQSRLKIRRCYRYQAAAFASGLGLGVLLPEMATIPRAVSA